jgi:hypothetical protein
MEPAAQILTIYGVLSLAYGFVLGLPLGAVRMGAAAAPRHLVTAHLAAIIQGAVHLGLTVAVGLATLPEWLEVLGALLLVGGSCLFVSGATLNWLHKVGDHFAERSWGWRLLSASGPLHLTGIVIFVVGVVRTVAA